MKKFLALLIISTVSAFAQTSSTARHIYYGASTPASCSATTGDVFFKTSATVTMYICTAANTWTALASGGGGISGLTTTKIPKAASATSLSDSNWTDDGTYLIANAPVDIKSNSLIIEIANSASPGTTANKLVKIPAAVASILTTSSADVISAVGVVIAGAGTTGSAKIGVLGQFSCLFDNTATTAGDFITPSSATAATCHDAGSTYPTTGEVMGQVLSSHAACGSPPCGPYTVLFGTPDVFLPGSGGSNGNGGNGGSGNRNTNRTACMVIGADNGSALADADLGPLSRYFLYDSAATITQISVAADNGTPNVIVGRSRAGVISNLTSSALATAASGGIACSKTTGVTGLDGTTTCSATLQNTGINAGDWLTLVSGTAGGTAKEMTVCVTSQVN